MHEHNYLGRLLLIITHSGVQGWYSYRFRGRANVERVWRQHLKGGVSTFIEPLVRRHIVPELRRSALHEGQNPALTPVWPPPAPP